MTTVASVPATRSAVSRPVIVPRNDLREVPSTIGRPSVGELVQAVEELEVVLEGLGEADARIDLDALSRDARRATAASIRSARKALTSATTSS